MSFSRIWTTRYILGSGLALGVMLGAVLLPPARWADVLMSKLSNGTVRFADAKGSLWSGHGQMQIFGPSASGAGHQDDPRMPVVVIDQFSWQWQFFSSIKAIQEGNWISLQISGKGLEGAILREPIGFRGLVTSFFGGRISLTLPDGHLSLARTELSEFGGLLSIFQPAFSPRISWQGMFNIHPDAGLPAGAKLDLELRDSSSALSPIRPLGTYRLSVGHAGGQVSWQILSIGNPVLKITGTGAWSDKLRGQVFWQCTRSCEFVEGLMAAVGKKQGDGYETKLGD